MALILLLESATRTCSVGLAKDGKLIAIREVNEGNSHSEKLTVFVQEVLKETEYSLSDLDAVAVCKGPGSYTGLRIGASTAKGLCYGAEKPLLSVGSLEAMAIAANDPEFDFFVPMIDARRMEVYAQVFDAAGKELRGIQADIVDKETYAEWLNQGKTAFFGDGAMKCQEVITHPNAVFVPDQFPSVKGMVPLVEKAFVQGEFEDVAYFEPFYLKDFVAGKPKKLL